MTDLCLRGGLQAYEEFNSQVSIDKLYEDICNKLHPNRISLLKKIITECPDHAKEIDHYYYNARIDNIIDCSRDTINNGRQCSILGTFTKPYSEWKSYQCKTSCLAEYDAIYQEYAKSPSCSEIVGDDNICKTFSSGNPLESCGNPKTIKK